MVKFGVGLVVLTCVFLPACGDEDEKTTNDETSALEISGSWTGMYGDEEITDEIWTSFGPQAIVDFSNDDNFAVWQNPDDAAYNPGKFGRNVWTEIEDGSFYYCSVAFMSETAEATADDAEESNTDDLDNSGCGAMDAPWTKLTRK